MEKSTLTTKDVDIIAKDSLSQGIFKLSRYTLRHRLFNGEMSDVFTRELLERRYQAAAILPYDPVLDRVILIEQFRPGSLYDKKSPWLIEIPAGLLDKESKPSLVANSEAFEEAGCQILAQKTITEYYVSPGCSTEFIYLYCGKVDASQVSGVHGLKEENEDISVINLPFEEALTHVYEGRIQTAPALIALLWLQAHRDILKKEWA